MKPLRGKRVEPKHMPGIQPTGMQLLSYTITVMLGVILWIVF